MFYKVFMGSIIKIMLGLVLAGLVVMSSSLLASLFWQFFTPTEDAPLVIATPMEKNKTVTKAPIDYGREIANLHLFGKEEKKAIRGIQPTKIASRVKSKSKPKPIKTKESLNIILSGVLVRKKKPSFAILNVAGKSGVYRIRGKKLQEELKKDVKLIEIHPKKVVLDYDGKKITLELSANNKPQKRANRRVRPQTTRRTRPPVNRQPDAQANNLAPEPEDGLTPLPANTEKLGELRNVLLSEPHRFTELVRLNEARDKDRNLIGYRLSPGKNRAFFRGMGLRPGDIAIEVNGISLNDPMNGLKVMSTIPTASNVILKIKRGNQIITLNKDF